MTWVRIDDGAPLHPKLLDVGPEPAWLWVAGLAHCNRHVTNGAIAKAHLGALYPWDGWSQAKIRRLADALVARGMWIDEGDRYRVHEYDEYQEEALKDRVEERRAAARERKRRQRLRDKSRSEAPCHAVTGRDVTRDSHGDNRVTGARDVVRDATRDAPARLVVSRPPVPSRPVPSKSPSETEARSADGSADGALSGQVREVFDHWRAVFGKSDATKLDAKRKRRIEWALRTYGFESVKRCVDGYGCSEWHRGRNDRGQVYDDIELFLRDAKRVEAGIELGGAKPGRARAAPVQPDPASAAESQRLAAAIFGEVSHG